jgi:uncharacterized membrane protein YhhN
MKISLVVFAVVSVAHIAFIILQKEKLRRVSKVLIIPPLLGAYIAGTGGNALLFPIPALVLGWLGDVLLIKIEKKFNFMLGLAAFLLGHLCYTIAFAEISGFFGFGGFAGGLAGNLARTINIPAVAIFVPQVLILGIVVFRLIKPLKEMFVPVIFYMTVLAVMGLFGLQAFLFNPGFAGLLIISGCFNFMISDTILAYYTFRKEKISGSVLIMFFYILAQAEIVLGLMLMQG